MLAIAPGDWMGTDPHRAPVEPIEGARILELSSPDDWHALCVRHASAVRTRSGSPAGSGTIVPNWRSVEREWDGIHLTFLGLLTTLFVRTETTEGASMLWSWDAEGTTWLRPELLAPIRTPESRDTGGGAHAVGLPGLDNHHLRWPPAPFDPDDRSMVLLQVGGSPAPLDAGDRESVPDREEILRRAGYPPGRRQWTIRWPRLRRWGRRR
jgi:hypothetical protein